MPAGGLSRRGLSEGVSIQARTTCRMPPYLTRGDCDASGVLLNADPTKRTSVTYHGSSPEGLRRQGVTPLHPPPGCPWTRFFGEHYGFAATSAFAVTP